MKIVKAKCIVYDCKTHEKKVVIKEMPVFDPPKPVPPAWEIEINRLKKDIPLKCTEINETINAKAGKAGGGITFYRKDLGTLPAGLGKIYVDGTIGASYVYISSEGNNVYPTTLKILIDGNSVLTLTTKGKTSVKKSVGFLCNGGDLKIVASTGSGFFQHTNYPNTPGFVDNMKVVIKVVEVV